MPTTLLNSPRPDDVQSMSTDALRSAFVVTDLFAPGPIRWTFTDLDRLAIAGIQPGAPVALENERQAGREFFLARRELGAINIGAPGIIRCDGRAFELNPLDCLYIPMGTRSVTFESRTSDTPARFYCISCPAHQPYPATLVRRQDASPIALGTPAAANQRRLCQYIHEKGIRSCQLVMGFTELAEGSVWNTMPPHTHTRRSEIYFYFDINGGIIAHFLGPPQATRHVFLHERQAVLSPPWSIHAGCGTASYRFVWAMAGENQAFDDMDPVDPASLR